MASPLFFALLAPIGSRLPLDSGCVPICPIPRPTLRPRSSILMSTPAEFSMHIPDTVQFFCQETQGLCPPQTHGLSSMMYPTAQTSKAFGILRQDGGEDVLSFCLAETGFLVACPSSQTITTPNDAAERLLDHLSMTNIKLSAVYSHPALIAALHKIGHERSLFETQPWLSNIQLEAPTEKCPSFEITGFSFRIAQKADVFQLEQCLNAFNEELGLKAPMNMADTLIKQQAAFLLIDDATQEIVSICCAAGDSTISSSLRITRISCLFTPKKSRGRGLARILLGKALEHLRQAREGSLIRLYVNALFPPIRKFYREAGFIEQDEGQVYECVKILHTGGRDTTTSPA